MKIIKVLSKEEFMKKVIQDRIKKEKLKQKIIRGYLRERNYKNSIVEFKRYKRRRAMARC